MDGELKISYETMGTSSYMTVACPLNVELIHYQFEMILSNDIQKFLPVSRQIMDGETIMYYNITSRVSLASILEKRKLKRKELLHLIEGAILSIRDASDFRLPADGIVMDMDWIYVNPASCDPAFIFLPIQGIGGSGLKGMLSELIFNDRIEMSDDNLIQVLLKELNSQSFSIDQLERSLKPYSSTNSAAKKQTEKWQAEKVQTITPQPITYSQPPLTSSVQSESWRPVNQQAVNQQLSAHQQAYSGMPNVKEKVQKEVASEKKLKSEKKLTFPKGKVEDEKDVSKEFDAEKAKKMFMLPQALIMVIVVASISFGLFQDGTGGIAVNTILAFIIGIVLIEVILYREIFINSKNSKNTKKTSAKKEKTEKKKPLPAGIRPVPPKPYHSETTSQEQISVSQSQPSLSQPMVSSPMPSPALIPQPIPVMQSGGSSSEDTVSETEWWEESGEGKISAYLEYYENGRLSRIPVDPVKGTVIGRLNSQVDFVVKSPKVGKIHARFFYENGQYFVVDINSKNGTYINGSGMRIDSNMAYPLHDKDRIMLADSEFTIRCTEG